MSVGIIYANSGHEDHKYVLEAVRSAQSFKAYIPEARIVLYTDVRGFTHDIFNDVIYSEFVVPPQLQDRKSHKNGQMLVKHKAMVDTPFERTLVLGSDTFAIKPDVAEMFPLLDHFDIAAAHAPYRINCMRGTIPDVPKAYPEFNCDVILYRRTEAVLSVLRKWRQMYETDVFGHAHDQGTFRYLMYYSDLRIATLPPEYNYRGSTVQKDTVVIQNRDLVDQYIQEKGMPTGAG